MNLNWRVNKPHKQRERFASPLAIGGLIVAGLLLLFVLYPEKRLHTLLESPDASSQAQQSYLEIMLKVQNNDADLVFALVRSYLIAALPDKAEQALVLLPGTLTFGQSKTAALLKAEIRRQQQWNLHAFDVGLWASKQQYSRLVTTLLQSGTFGMTEGVNPNADATGKSVDRTYRELNILSGANMAPSTLTEGTETAEQALARGDYRQAAAIHFKNMERATGNERRSYFLAGVAALQSGNLLDEAVKAGETHLGPLHSDRATLIFLTRLALAANQPTRAQKYVRRALKIDDSHDGGA